MHYASAQVIRLDAISSVQQPPCSFLFPLSFILYFVFFLFNQIDSTMSGEQAGLRHRFQDTNDSQVETTRSSSTSSSDPGINHGDMTKHGRLSYGKTPTGKGVYNDCHEQMSSFSTYLTLTFPRY